jgi:hypothetical protein
LKKKLKKKEKKISGEKRPNESKEQPANVESTDPTKKRD